MMKLIKDFIREEDGMGTIEVVIIVGILVALALIFKDGIATFAKKLMEKIFNTGDVNTKDMDKPEIS